jgi:hypothetical protein
MQQLLSVSINFLLILQPYFQPFLTLSDHIFIYFETSPFFSDTDGQLCGQGCGVQGNSHPSHSG